MLREFTPAAAVRYLENLHVEKQRLLEKERLACTYETVPGERAEPPEYDYVSTRSSIDLLDDRARAVRHALNAFIAHEALPMRGMTIDEALIEMARLRDKADRLDLLRRLEPKMRVGGRSGDRVGYECANFDVRCALEDYAAVSEAIEGLQLEIDPVVHTRTFTVDVA